MLSNIEWIILCIAVLILASLGLLLRAIGRRVREDYRLGRAQRTKTYGKLTLKFAGIAAFSLLYAGFRRHEWIPALGFAAFAAAMSATFWLNKPKAQ